MSEREMCGYSGTAGTGYIQCPYFIAHARKEIYCEGLFDGCRCAMMFDTEEGKKNQQHNYCENNFRRCEMFLSITHWKWPEE